MLTTTTAVAWGRQLMTKTAEKVQGTRIDARNLWLPVTTMLVFVAIGMWIQKTNDKAVATDAHATQLAQIKSQLDTLQGSITVLVGMQQTLSDTRSDVDGLKEDLKEMEREHRLFQDFVEGRIGSMPYRPSSTEGGSR